MPIYERIIELDEKIVKRTFHKTMESAMKVDDNIYYHQYLELLKKGEHIPKKFVIKNRKGYFYFSHTIERRKYKKIRIIIKAVYCDCNDEVYCLAKTGRFRTISVPDVFRYGKTKESMLQEAMEYKLPRDWTDEIPSNYKYRYLTILRFSVYQ